MARGDWQRVSKRRPCPVCERPDWCLFVGDDDSPAAALCMRVESDRPARSGGGWLHVLRTDSPTWATWKKTYHVAAQEAQPSATIAEIRAEWIAASRATTGAKLSELAAGLGVSATSLYAVHAAWMPKRRAWGFAMGDAQGRLVGVRLRLLSGKKLSIKGGREGLFYSNVADLQDVARGGRLLIAEGPTDTGALLDLGFACIGRPSCSGGVKHLVELVKRLGPSEVVIVADGDQPGQRGANNLASALLVYVPAVRVIVPPSGVKDARAWKQAGASATDVKALIAATAKKALKITVRSSHEMASLRSRP